MPKRNDISKILIIVSRMIALLVLAAPVFAQNGFGDFEMDRLTMRWLPVFSQELKGSIFCGNVGLSSTTTADTEIKLIERHSDSVLPRVLTVLSDEHGDFQIWVSPGNWKLSAVGKCEGKLRSLGQVVRVVSSEESKSRNQVLFVDLKEGKINSKVVVEQAKSISFSKPTKCCIF